MIKVNRLEKYWYDNEFHYFYDGSVYGDPNFFIEYTVNENPNLLYFKVYRDKRIFMVASFTSRLKRLVFLATIFS